VTDLTDVKMKTYADYAHLEESAPYQLINGMFVKSPSPVPYHQTISKHIQFELFKCEQQGKGKVFNAPIDVYLSEYNTFQPDLLFIVTGRLSIIGEKKIEGPPDIVIEILSPHTAYYDLREKKQVYEEYGVKEYWIVDPMARRIDVYTNKKKRYILMGSAVEKGKISSGLLKGFSVELESLFTR
jgi:Uma2 family endonuclease